jgi:KDO2-lipid IV(A) lauroyltransferase
LHAKKKIVLFFKLLSYLPFPILYLLSDFLFFMAYYVVKYRRNVVWKNLKNAFPAKSEKELRSIEKQFYHNFADTSVETLKLLSISEEALLRRVRIDSALTRKYYSLGYSAFGMTAHFCNWEWLLVASSNQLGLKLHAAYKRLRSPVYDQLMISIRSRFGVVLHEKDDVVRSVMLMKDHRYLMAMVADQRPFSGENKYWTRFMNQDSAFMTGSEVLARRKDIKVVYASMQRIKRGYYEVTFKEVEVAPKQTIQGQITEKFIELVEEDINKDPASYLWSHDRWKLKKPTKTDQFLQDLHEAPEARQK